MDWLAPIEDSLTHPPVPFEPEKSSLKAWAMYCLRDRGFKVVYAEKGDFAVELHGNQKVYFRVTQDTPTRDDTTFWIVYNPNTHTTRIVTPNIS